LTLQLFLDVKRSVLNLDFYAGDRAATPLRGQLLPSKESASEASCRSEASGLRWKWYSCTTKFFETCMAFELKYSALTLPPETLGFDSESKQKLYEVNFDHE
jgi:hypothetical protein